MVLPIPLVVLEAVTGALMAAFLLKFVMGVLYLRREWRIHRLMGRPFYSYEHKAGIALTTISMGMTINVGASWWAVHRRMLGELSGFGTSMVITGLYVAGALWAIWGLICLMRALTPYSWWRSAWVWTTGFSVGFGALSATQPQLFTADTLFSWQGLAVAAVVAVILVVVRLRYVARHPTRER